MLIAQVANCQVATMQVIQEATDCTIQAVKPKGHYSYVE